MNWKRVGGVIDKARAYDQRFHPYTEPRHKAYVQALLSKLHAQGDFYRKMSGFLLDEGGNLPDRQRPLARRNFDPIMARSLSWRRRTITSSSARTRNG
jgi:hypothetical protein